MMGKLSQFNITSKAVMTIVLVCLMSATVSAVTVATLTVNPIDAGSGTLSESTNIAIDSQNLVYEGNNVTSVDVTVNNTDSTSHTIDLYVAVIDSADATVTTGTVTGASVSASSLKTVSVTLGTSPGVDEFQEVEVTVEETG